jgi:predicted amidohydrolase YtcJ/D-aminopeptidase
VSGIPVRGVWAQRPALLAIALAFSAACVIPAQAADGGAAPTAPDRIYVNGRVWTGASDDGFAQAFAVSGNRIVAVGDDASILARAGAGTDRVDLEGRLVTPGLMDNHTHFMDASLSLAGVDLRDAATPAEFSKRIAARAKERPGEWITHGNWDHELWGAKLPHRDWVDTATAETPVFVVRLDGHMGLANSAALKLAGIDASTRDPGGGEIVRDADGKPTGLLKDAAMNAVYAVIPPPSAARVDEAMARGYEEALSRGLTQIHDMSDGNWRALEAFRRQRAAGSLPLRVYSFVPIADWAKMAEFVRANGRGDDWLRWGALKGFVDGSLGSTTAWFHEPFTDSPHTSGLTMVDPDELAKQIQGGDRAGLHLAVHAIGDRAIDWLLGTYERVARENGPRERRWRNEHAQHLRPDAFRRFKTLGVVASMQPYHAIDDGRWAEKRIGAERIKGTYAFRSFLDAGAVLTFGSDWAVAPLDPLTGVDAAVNRRTIDGKNPGGWQPQQRISVAQALRAYTSANAYAGFQDDRLGRIAPGYLADFVVWSENLFAIDPLRIPEVRAVSTVIDGQERYSNPEVARRGTPWRATPYEPSAEALKQGPRILLVCDMEGLSGQDDIRTSEPEHEKEYALGRRLLTDDVNAVVAGLYAGGARSVSVMDGHGGGNRVIDVLIDEVDGRAEVIRRAPLDAYSDLATPGAYDAVAAVGMHPRSRSGGFLAHTYTFGIEITLSGRPVSESELLALAYGAVDIPLIFVSGDDVLGRSLREMDWIEYVAVKESVSPIAANPYPLPQARKALRAGAKRAVGRLRAAKVAKLSGPVEVTVKPLGTWSFDWLRGLPGVRFSGNALAFDATDFPAAYRGIETASSAVAMPYYDLMEKMIHEQPNRADIERRLTVEYDRLWLEGETGKSAQ